LTSDVRRSMRGGSTLTYLRADYDELAQVRTLAIRVANTVERLDTLINNAGRAGPPRRTLSIDGNETTLQTNYLATFLLTTMLRPLLEGGHRSRIVNVASATHLSATLQLDDLGLARHEYTPVRAYYTVEARPRHLLLRPRQTTRPRAVRGRQPPPGGHHDTPPRLALPHAGRPTRAGRRQHRPRREHRRARQRPLLR